MNETKKIVIIGAPRSGTTLLSGLLTGSEECFPNIPECTYITQVIEHYYNIISYHDKERFNIYAKDNNTLFKIYDIHIKNFLSIVESNFKEKESYLFMVLKDPLITKYIDLIVPFFGSETKIVFITRDPRSIVSSMLKVEIKKKVQRSFSEMDLVKSITNEIFNYYYIVHNSNTYKNNNLYVIKYEDIIQKKEKVFEDLEKYIGYSFCRTPFMRNSFNFDINDPTYSQNYIKSTIENKISYTENLKSKDIKYIQKVFSGLNIYYKWW